MRVEAPPAVSESEFDVTATAGKQKNGVVTGAVETDAVPALLECAAGPTAGESKGITAVLEVRESDFSKTDGVAVAVATAGESDRNLGLRPVIETHSRHNSSWGVVVVAGARVSALPGVSATASSSASAFCVCCWCCTCALHTHA